MKTLATLLLCLAFPMMTGACVWMGARLYTATTTPLSPTINMAFTPKIAHR